MVQQVTRVDARKWTMVVDIDRCNGCQACVVACQSENNIPLNTPERFMEGRAIEWIRVERYWEGTAEAEESGDPSKVKAHFIPVLCQHCDNAPCEPVCPVYATYHSNEGLNVQVYNRCVGTRYCANNDPYQVRFFNYYQPIWPETLKSQLNPDVTVRNRGIMEKCSFCVQRVRAATQVAKTRGEETKAEYFDQHGKGNNGQWQFAPACVRACPTDALLFGDVKDDTSPVRKYVEPGPNGHSVVKEGRAYKLLAQLGTEPNVIYLKKVDIHASDGTTH